MHFMDRLIYMLSLLILAVCSIRSTWMHHNFKKDIDEKIEISVMKCGGIQICKYEIQIFQ